MKNQNFTYSFKTKNDPSRVFQILLDVEQWWSGLFEEKIKGKSKKVHDEFTFEAGEGAHYSKQKLVEVIPGKKIVWLVTESNLSFLSDPNEWTGSKLQFELSVNEKYTEVIFTHEGLIPKIECYDACSSAWTGYLKKLGETLNQ